MKTISRLSIHHCLCVLFLGILPPSYSQEGRSQVKLEEIEHEGFRAYRLSNGETEAIVSPSVGRLLVYRISGSLENLLWENPGQHERSGWVNWGGEKTFIGPHERWTAFAKSIWPPPLQWDEFPHEVKASSGKLSTTGPLWSGFGIQIERNFSFTDTGHLVIEQVLHKVEGVPVEVCVWNVAQFRTPERVSFAVKSDSPYPNGFLPIGRPLPIEPVVADGVLHLEPKPGKAYKFGVDTNEPIIRADYAQWEVEGSARLQTGNYPDGKEGKPGFSVEFYNHGPSGDRHVHDEDHQHKHPRCDPPGEPHSHKHQP